MSDVEVVYPRWLWPRTPGTTSAARLGRQRERRRQKRSAAHAREEQCWRPRGPGIVGWVEVRVGVSRGGADGVSGRGGDEAPLVVGTCECPPVTRTIHHSDSEEARGLYPSQRRRGRAVSRGVADRWSGQAGGDRPAGENRRLRPDLQIVYPGQHVLTDVAVTHRSLIPAYAVQTRHSQQPTTHSG